MEEYYILILLIGIPLLYSLGGMINKGIRRYGIPGLLFIISFLAGTITLQSVIAILVTCGVLHLGYGDGSSWWERALYAVSISLPTLIIGFNWWIVIPPIVFITTFILSRWGKTKILFNWRICEFLVGASLGILWSQVIC